MLNQIVLVGRLVKDPEVVDNKGIITLAIPRCFKNANGQYDTDFVECITFDGVATNTIEYCKKGDIVGIKGRIQSKTIEKEDETKEYQIEIIAEKVTFLSSKKED